MPSAITDIKFEQVIVYGMRCQKYPGNLVIAITGYITGKLEN